MSEIVYPQGCRSVTEDLGPDELIRRLKVLLENILLIAVTDYMQDTILRCNKYVDTSAHIASYGTR